jgi:hypothetical protein
MLVPAIRVSRLNSGVSAAAATCSSAYPSGSSIGTSGSAVEEIIQQLPERRVPRDPMPSTDEQQTCGAPILPAPHYRGHGRILLNGPIRVVTRRASAAKRNPHWRRCQSPCRPLLDGSAPHGMAPCSQLGNQLACGGAVPGGGWHTLTLHAPFEGRCEPTTPAYLAS